MERSVTFKEKNEQSFGYSADFKKMIIERPGLIVLFQKLVAQLKNIGDNVSEGDVTVRLFNVRDGVPIPGRDMKKSPYFKVDIGGDSFFVKSCPGYKELKDTLNAKEKLANLPGVQVVDAHYGFTDKNGDGYFVAKWIDLPTVEELRGKIPEEKFDKIEKRIEQAKQILGSAYFDTRTGNAFYDEQGDKDIIILFDLNESQSILKLQGK